jgi:hypothetical protein
MSSKREWPRMSKAELIEAAYEMTNSDSFPAFGGPRIQPPQRTSSPVDISNAVAVKAHG